MNLNDFLPQGIRTIIAIYFAVSIPSFVLLFHHWSRTISKLKKTGCKWKKIWHNICIILEFLFAMLLGFFVIWRIGIGLFSHNLDEFAGITTAIAIFFPITLIVIWSTITFIAWFGFLIFTKLRQLTGGNAQNNGSKKDEHHHHINEEPWTLK